MASVILAFGYHDRESPRHRTVCAELTKDGSSVVECHTDEKGLLGKSIDLKKKYRFLSRTADAVLVPFPGHFLMPLAWMLTRFPRKRVTFDAFVSLYDTDVTDRKRFSPWHPHAWLLWCIDWLSMHLADEVLIDTKTHRDFLIREFGLKPERVRVIYLEARADLFHLEPARQRTTDKIFNVFFYGTVIPLQGINYILDAARLLEEKKVPVRFLMLGSSGLKTMIDAKNLTSVTYHGFAPIEELPGFIHDADLCLGIFGVSGKAARVIPHKVIDAIACGVPVLTEDSPAICERFAHNPLMRLVPAGNAQAIADAIAAMAQTKA